MQTIVIEVMGGVVADVWAEEDSEAIIFDHDTKETATVAVNKGIPDFALEHPAKYQQKGERRRQ